MGLILVHLEIIMTYLDLTEFFPFFFFWDDWMSKKHFKERQSPQSLIHS